MLNIAVIEDEALIAKRLMRFIRLALKNPDHKIHYYASFDDAEEYLSEHSIDLLFLDLNLNGQDGFKLLKSHLSSSYHTIVVSANTDRAMEAFELGVLDFVGKPFSQERIKNAMERAINSGFGFRKNNRTLSVEKKGKIETVALNEIAFIRAAGHYSELVLIDGSIHLHSKALGRIIDVLPQEFEQVHRSYVVDLSQISELLRLPGSQYELVLKSGQHIPLGRSYYAGIKKMLAGA